MRKKLITAALCLVLVLALTGCTSRPYSKYDLSEYIKLGKYKGLKVEEKAVKVTDKQVDARIKEQQENAVVTENVTEGKVEEGDTIVINFDGKIDGKSFEGGNATNYTLTVGSGAFIPGFESGLVGAEVGGDPVELKLKFPETYPNGPELAGKDVVFTVSVVSKQVQTLPELDREFFKSQGSNAKDLESYKAELKEQMTEEAEEAATEAQRAALWDKVLNNAKVLKDEDGNYKYPQEEVDKAKERIIQQYKDYAESYGMTYEELIETQTGETVEEMEKEVEEYVRTEVVKEDMVIYAIAEKESISVTRIEYNDYKEQFCKDMGFKDEKEFESAVGMSVEDYVGGKESLQREIYKEKVLDLIMEEADTGDKDKKKDK